MAAYSFNSEPRVVSTRSEKYAPGERMTMNLMYDKRVFRGHVHDIHNIRPVLSPQEQEELHIQKEKEKKQEEMMKRQLDAFKKNKTKQSPYDIRPAATGRIEVDLQYFLTDQKDIKPNDSEICTQTDKISQKIPDPPFVPKKTGRDVTTQIEDGDLFNFNQEVQPILNVLTSKTLEQALLEVEEENELSKMAEFKAQNTAKRIEEEKIWANMVQEEVEKIKKKNQEVKKAMEKYVKTQNLIKKFQNLNIAKGFLSGLVPKLLDEVTESILAADNFENLLVKDYLPFIVQGTEKYLKGKLNCSENLKEIASDCQDEMRVSRKKLIQQHKQKAQKEQTRNINYSESKRLVRFLYQNPEFSVQSEFAMRILPALKGEEYSESVSDQLLLKDAERKDADDSTVNEENKGENKPEWMNHTCFIVDDIKRFGFAIANHPIQDTPRDSRKYGICAEFYGENGDLLYCVDSVAGGEAPGCKHFSNCRDMTKKTSYDEMIILTLTSLSAEVNSVVLYTYSARNVPAEFIYANYALMDFTTSQKFDSKRIKLDDFSPDENNNTLPLYFAYRISRKEKNPRTLKVLMVDNTPTVEMDKEENHWVLDIYNLPISKPFEETRQIIAQVNNQGFSYSTNLVDGLIEYRKKKLLEDIEYKKQIEENEQPGSKKKKKRPAKGKTIEEPVKMTEYVKPEELYPNRTFGPVFIDTGIDTLETLKLKISQVVDPQLLETWELGMNILIKGKEIKKPNWVLKAHTIKDLKIDQKLPEKIVLVQDEENLDS